MGKFNLSDAAKAILTEGSKETFDSNISSKSSGKDKPQKLNPAVAYGTKDAGKIGDSPNDVNDPNPDYTKGVPTATPPGATPPVGSEPMKKLGHQPAQDKAGDTGSADMGGHQGTENSYDSIRDRVKAKLAKQTMKPNPGATFQSYSEESENEDEEVVAEEKEEKGHEDAAQDKAMIKKMMKKEKMKEQMEQDVDALLSGENLSEEFKDKATTIFEAAVIARTQAVMEDIEQALFEEFEVAVEEIKEDLATKLDDYINYMAEEWLKENQLAVEKGLRAEIVESFINGMKDLFTEHYIDIPEEKVDVVEELTTKVQELEDSLNEQIQSAVELKKELNESKKTEAIHAVCEGLTQTQVEKMKSLAEGVDFTTDEEFADKLVTLRESYFNEPVITSGSSALNEEVHIEDDKKPTGHVDAEIAQYAQTISKTLIK
jgi:hypothetical protein